MSRANELPPRAAARSFSFRPPIGSTRPRSVISPVIATSWRTGMPVMTEMMVDVANIGGMGFDNLRWLRPVHPNEPLDVELTVNSVTPSKSKPDRGVLHYTLSAKNPEGEVVFSTDTPVMIQRKQNDTD